MERANKRTHGILNKWLWIYIAFPEYKISHDSVYYFYNLITFSEKEK